MQSIADLCEADWVRWRTSGISSSIVVATVAYLSLGLAMFAVWLVTEDDRWVTGFFKVPGALMALCLAGMSLALSCRAVACFAPGEPMHSAWSLFRLSAMCDVLNVLAIQFFAATSELNPLLHSPFWGQDFAERCRTTGMIMGGTVRYTLLACALWYALKAYRKTGLLARYRAADHAVLTAMAAFVIYEMLEVITVLRTGKEDLGMVLGWPVDPLLWFLLAEALLLRRSASEMGGGWIGRCWKALSLGVMLVAVGDVFLMVTRLGYLPWQYGAIGWYIWLPAGAAFALAPAYQVEAVAQAAGIRAVR